MVAAPQATMNAPRGPRNPRTFTVASLAAWFFPKLMEKIRYAQPRPASTAPNWTSRWAGVQNVSRPMVSCQTISQYNPDMMQATAMAEVQLCQGILSSLAMGMAARCAELCAITVLMQPSFCVPSGHGWQSGDGMVKLYEQSSCFVAQIPDQRYSGSACRDHVDLPWFTGKKELSNTHQAGLMDRFGAATQIPSGLAAGILWRSREHKGLLQFTSTAGEAPTAATKLQGACPDPFANHQEPGAHILQSSQGVGKARAIPEMCSPKMAA